MKKTLPIIGLAAGGVLVGALAGQMHTVWGTVGFVVGICLMVFSAVALGKQGEIPRFSLLTNGNPMV